MMMKKAQKKTKTEDLPIALDAYIEAEREKEAFLDSFMRVNELPVMVDVNLRRETT